MNLKDLHNEVCALGFDDYIECDGALATAANCALRMIFAERGVLCDTTFYVKSAAPATRVPHLCHKSGEELTLPLSGRAYSLRVVGRGELLITDGADRRLITFDTDGELIRGFLNKGGSISLRGDYAYSVFDLCTYSDAFSNTTESIPDGSGRRICYLPLLVEDYGSVTGAVRNGADSPIPDACIIGDTITLPEEYEGAVRLTYCRTPRRIDAEHPEERIDIPSELEPLLPMATAAFICLEGDAEKSEYYTALYRRMLAAVNTRNKVYAPHEYRTNGWA